MVFTTIADKFPTHPFNRSRLREIVGTGNQEHIINYINLYFFKTFNGFIYVNVINHKAQVQNLNVEKISNYLPRKMRIFDNKGKIKFDVQEWFLNENDDIYQFTFAPERPLIYTECGNSFINMFIPPKHDLKKTYEDYADDVKDNVNTVLNHLYEVLCDSDDTLYTYILNWYANVCMFKKNKTGLYFKSSKGTGKSIFNDNFINNKVLQHLAHKSSDCDLILGYNSQLSNKTMLLMEELPVQSGRQWFAFGDKLQDMVTSDTIGIKEKYVSPIDMPNFLNIVVISNHNALPFSVDQRRFVVAQISEKRIGDSMYFTQLAKAINDNRTATAFISMMRERYVDVNVSKFDFTKLPKTEADKELHIENLPQHYQFVKDEYIAKGRDFKDTVADTYNKYVKYFKGTHPVKKNTFGKYFKPLGFVVAQKTINKKPCKVWDTSFDEMVKIFEKKGWMHEDDDVDAGDIIEENYKKEMQYYMQRNNELETRVEELEAMLFNLQNKN